MTVRHTSAKIGTLSTQTSRWNAWVLTQDTVWIDRENNVHEVAKLDPEYALNILVFLHEHKRGEIGVPEANPLCTALRKRILSPVEPAKAAETMTRDQIITFLADAALTRRPVRIAGPNLHDRAIFVREVNSHLVSCYERNIKRRFFISSISHVKWNDA